MASEDNKEKNAQHDDKDAKIDRLEKELKFAKKQVAKALELYDEARQEADIAIKAKGEFFSKLSHEFRTPMNALIGYSDLLIRKNESETTRRYASGVKSSSNRLLNLFNNMLEVSRIELGTIISDCEEYDTGVLINTIMDSFSNEAKEKGLLLKLDFDDRLPCKMYGDFYHSRQIVCNLIDNAVKYTNKGYVSVDIEANFKDETADSGRKIIQMIFHVKDTGTGIRKKDKDKLFEAFEQFNSKNPYANQGVGVGLNVAKFYANMMDGDISFESSYGEGSVFTCTFVQEIVDETPISEVYTFGGNNRREIVFTAPKAHVLIVDDSIVNLNVAKGLLEDYDIDADMAEGGMEAIKKVGRKIYDLIFMDHMMPDIDGIETMKRIRDKGNWCETVPIIALTANTTDEARQLFKMEGMQDFLAKPIEIGLLRDILLKWLPKEKIMFSDIGRGYVTKRDEQLEIGKTAFTKSRLLQEGIDLEVGLSHFGGNIKAYRETMRDILTDCTRKAELAENYLAVMDLQNYAIEAHSAKSVAATIGAIAFTEIAKESELRAKAGDIEYIEEYGSYFIRKYMEFLSSIETILQEERLYESENNKPDEKSYELSMQEQLTEEEIRRIMVEAIAAINDYEADIAVDKIGSLLSQKKNVELTEKLYRVQEMIDDFEYKEAVEIMEELVK